jgi:hypothetical protein
MIGRILSWLTSGGIAAIGKQINDWQRIKAEAQNDARRIEAEEKIAQLEARRDILIAEQGSWMTRWIRPALAAPVVIFVWKILVWDTVLGWGITPEPGELVRWVVTATIGAYFLTRPFEKR